VVQLLLTNGANLNLQEEGGDCHHCSLPLYIAAESNNSELLELLLKHGADVNTADIDGNIALHHAIEYYWPPNSDNSRYVSPVVDTLLEHKADVNKENKYGDTPLCLAVSEGLLEVVNKMLEVYGGNPNKGSPAKSPLVAACLTQNVALVDTLLKHGADPNLTWTSCDPYSTDIYPLFVAVYKGNSDIITKLLNAGADVNGVDSEGISVVWYATAKIINSGNDQPTEEMRNKLSTVRLLLEHGADVNMLKPDGILPLYKVVNALTGAPRCRSEYRTCLIELLQLMVKYGADLHDFRCQLEENVALRLVALASFDGVHDFILELFRAGAGFELLARCCNAVATFLLQSKSISLCQAVILAGHNMPSARELQRLQLAAALDRSADHLIQQLVNWLNEDRQQVPSLLRQCRVVIRRQLSAAVQFRSILPAIDKLPLPTILKLYIQFDGPLTEVDLNVCTPTHP